MTPTQIVITTTRCNYPFYLESEPLLDYQSHFSYPLGVKHILKGFLVKPWSTLLYHGGMSLTISQFSSEYNTLKIQQKL